MNVNKIKAESLLVQEFRGGASYSLSFILTSRKPVGEDGARAEHDGTVSRWIDGYNLYSEGVSVACSGSGWSMVSVSACLLQGISNAAAALFLSS